MGQVNSPTNDLAEDEVLNFGVEDLIAEDDEIEIDQPSVRQLIKYLQIMLSASWVQQFRLNQDHQIKELITLLKLKKS